MLGAYALGLASGLAIAAIAVAVVLGCRPDPGYDSAAFDREEA